MKPKLNLLLLIGCLTIARIGFTQDNSAATTNFGAAPASEPATVPAAVPITDAPATNETVATASTNPAPVFAPVDANEPVAATPPPVAPVVAAPIAPSTPAAAPGTNSNIIPLIQFVDVPLTAAIENLARQADLNYILDPKIGYGQAGADGRTVPQPSISIRWENLTAEQALTAVLNNYDLQLVQDSKTKIARVAPKDPAAPEPLLTKVIQLKYASPSNVLASVQGTLTDRRSKVVPDVRTSQLVVVATDKEMIAVDELITHLDMPTRQVLIEANLLETSRNPSSVKGVDWSGTLQAQNVAFGNGIMSGTSVNTANPDTTTTLPGGRVVTTPGVGRSDSTILNTVVGDGGFNWNTLSGMTLGIGFLSADGARAVLSFLNSDNDTKVISTPRTITLDNETATVSVTSSNPVVNITASVAGVTSGSSQTTYVETGTKLMVTPRISANNLIRLVITPEVSEPQKQPAVNGQLQPDGYIFRKIQTQVLIPSGNTIVMGGLVSDSTSKGYSKVPVLGDLPLLGLAFRHESKQRAQKNLIIFITPTIVQDSDFQPTTTDYLKTPLPKDASSKPTISAWDSGKPYDWSKPFKKQSAEMP